MGLFASPIDSEQAPLPRLGQCPALPTVPTSGPRFTATTKRDPPHGRVYPGAHLRDLGVQPLAHLHAPMRDQHRAVQVHVHQRARLVEELGGEGDAELGGRGGQTALAPPAAVAEQRNALNYENWVQGDVRMGRWGGADGRCGDVLTDKVHTGDRGG